MTGLKVRLVAVKLEASLVTDDGTTLTPLPVGPQTVTAADWPNVVTMLADAVAEIEQQANKEPS